MKKTHYKDKATDQVYEDTKDATEVDSMSDVLATANLVLLWSHSASTTIDDTEVL